MAYPTWLTATKQSSEARPLLDARLKQCCLIVQYQIRAMENALDKLSGDLSYDNVAEAKRILKYGLHHYDADRAALISKLAYHD